MAKKKLTIDDVLISKEEIPYEVPENWCWVKLGGIAEIVTGNTPSKKNAEYYGDYIPFVKPADLDQGRNLVFSNEYLSEEGLQKARIIPKNSIAVCCIGSIGKSAFLEVDVTTNQQINSIIPKNINSLYLYYYILSEEFQKQLWKNSSATTISIINKSKMSNLNICIPPLVEQERIVNRIESLFEKIDKASELIEEAREGFEKRRAAILEKAFSGELTKSWREENNYSIFKLIDKIERSNIEEKKNFKFTESSEVFEIPDNWKWFKLKDLCTKFKYGTSTKSKPEGKVPVLRMGNLQKGYIDWGNLVYTSDDNEINKFELIKGDLLFNRTNSPELVGKTSIYNGEQEAIYAGYLIRVRTYEEINSKYINYFMNSTYAKARCYEVKTDGVSQSNINAEKLGDFDIPVPPIEEQDQIVMILDKILIKEDDIAEISNVFDNIDIIKKSILAKAFRGELGTNDINEESSIEIIKDIK